MVARYMPSRHKGEAEVNLYPYLTAAVEGGGLTAPRPATLPPGKRPNTHCTGGWVGLRSGWVRKIAPPPEFESQTVQPVGSRYTDYSIPGV
jgi:hypothetical protein